jgi:hypothetical protein
MAARRGIATPFKLEDATTFLKVDGETFLKGKRVRRFGKLYLPTDSAEAQRYGEILAILQDYQKRENPPRPLSIAVFGPPGSGKSSAVKNLAKEANIPGDPHIINLSQLESPREFGLALLNIFSLYKHDATRIVFLDEFDTALNRQPLGWLQWFLAPMQDSLFYYDGKPIATGKAILVFAGGTTERYEDFEVQPEDEDYGDFVERKGPDFVSRLRGHINVEGLNAYGPERILRRALALHYQLGARADWLKGPNDTRNIDEDLLERLLGGAHYKHGARSLEAFLDTCRLTEKPEGDAPEFSDDRLPLPEVMKLHVSHGPLEGLTIGISAGQDPSSTAFFEDLAKDLFERGANLAHGGDLLKDSPLEAMVEVVKNLPKPLIERNGKRIKNLLPHPSEFRKEVQAIRTEVEEFVAFLDQSASTMITLSPTELETLKLSKRRKKWFAATDGVDEHLAWAVSLFRMRFRLAQEIDALVVIGGKPSVMPDGAPEMSWGRFSGVAEEVMMALAFHRPVYLLGMAGGAAMEVGCLMGLSTTLHPNVSQFLQEPSDEPWLDFESRLKERQWSKCFEVPGKPRLPKTHKELREFLLQHSPNSPGNWPNNGLTSRENCQLFNTKDARQECIHLIIQGITRWSRDRARTSI